MSYVGAIAELKVKKLRQIQEETAQVWCDRALAARSLGLSTDATEYAHEAIEHAALSGNAGLLLEVRQQLKKAGIL